LSIWIKYGLGLLVLYVVYCGLLFIFQRQVLFPRGMIPTPAQSPLPGIPGLEKLWLTTRFGRVEAWFLPPLNGLGQTKSPAVIFGHGNGELIDYWPEALSPFTRLGMAVLLVEYPGYGRSEGSPSQESVLETFIAAYDNLASRKEIDPSRIVLFGRSLGGGAVAALSERRPSAALILMSTFTGTRSMVKRFLLPPFLARDPFDNLSAVRDYSGPVLIIHGKRDSIIPFSHGDALARAAGDATLISCDADHNDCPPNWEVFWRDVEGFLRAKEIL
jgi:uncharacterized protein